MFLVGGAAFSGKSLLAHLLNQGRVVCLDEPDFHDPKQRHRGIPVLQARFGDRRFPAAPDEPISHAAAVAFLRDCERAIAPCTLGMKTAGWTFVEYAKVYKAAGDPVIALRRDIRDVLVEAPLPPWIDGEQELNAGFRVVEEHGSLVDLWIRYEDLVADAAGELGRIAALLGHNLEDMATWPADAVDPTMVKLERHELLRAGRITSSQVGLWRTAGRAFSDETLRTAEMMGYGRD